VGLLEGVGGQGEPERGAAAGLGRGGELAAVGLDEAPADPEPEAGPGGTAVVTTEELGEDAGQVLVGDPGAPVSATDTATKPSWPTSPSSTMPVGLPYLTAFSTRLVITCSTLSGSA
jgi:hypothetical protein